MKNRLSTLIPCGRRRFSLSRCSRMVRRIIWRCNGERHIHVAPGLSRPEILFVAGYAEFHKFASPLDPNLADAAVPIDGAARCLFEIVAILNNLLPSADSPIRLNVKLDLGADEPAPVAGRQQADVGLVVSILDRGRCHLDLLDQLALIRIDRVKPIDHVVLVRMRCRVAQRAQGVHRSQGFRLPAVRLSHRPRSAARRRSG